MTPVGPIAPVGPVAPAGPTAPVGPVGPVAPVGPASVGIFEILSNFEPRRSSCFIKLSSVSRTLSFRLRISARLDGGPVNPGIVPSAYWIFSPSAFRICAIPSSSIAIDERRRLMVSSLESVTTGVILGKLGCDTMSLLMSWLKIILLRTKFPEMSVSSTVSVYSLILSKFLNGFPSLTN